MDSMLSLLAGPAVIVLLCALLGAVALAVAPLLRRQENHMRAVLHRHQRRLALAQKRLAALG